MAKVEIRDDVAKAIQAIADKEFRSLDGQVAYFLNKIVGTGTEQRPYDDIDMVIDNMFDIPDREEDNHDDDEDKSLIKGPTVDGMKEELPLPFPESTGERSEWEANDSVIKKNVLIRTHNNNLLVKAGKLTMETPVPKKKRRKKKK